MAHCPLRPLLRLLVLGLGWRRLRAAAGERVLRYAGPRPGGRAWEREPRRDRGAGTRSLRRGRTRGPGGHGGIRGQTAL